MINQLKPLIGNLTLFAKERMGFSHPPKLFLKQDSENSNMVLGRTAHYDPQQESVTLFVLSRHPKDILRSFAHELVHHTQNLRGDLSPEKTSAMTQNYAQDDDHLRNMEKEAYLQGNMCFRDWEDSLDDKTKYKIKIAESKFLKENKSMTTKITKEFLKETIKKILSENKPAAANADAEETPYPKTPAGYPVSNPDIPGPVTPVSDGKDDKIDENEMFAPNHYCVHHGGVQHEGKIVAAEAVDHNYNDELGKVTHYDMKLEDGTILENVAAEDIQVTNASLAEEHSHKRDDGNKAMKKKKLKNSKKADLNKDGKLSKYEKKRGEAIEKSMAAEHINTPEGENTLYEQRFTPKNNRLFEKLLKEWTK